MTQRHSVFHVHESAHEHVLRAGIVSTSFAVPEPHYTLEQGEGSQSKDQSARGRGYFRRAVNSIYVLNSVSVGVRTSNFPMSRLQASGEPIVRAGRLSLGRKNHGLTINRNQVSNCMPLAVEINRP
jgi:hypothetical protein